MQMLVVVLLIAVVALVSAANPPSPVWPTAFTASVLVDSNDPQNPPGFFRWIYSSTLAKERFSGIGQWQGLMVYWERLFDFNADNMWNIYYHSDGSVVCFTGKINGTLPHPVFTSFTYLGKALDGYNPVYHWYYANTFQGQNITMQYYDNQATREPARFDIADLNKQTALTLQYMEFDDEPVDSSLFNVPALILSQCNSNTPQRRRV